MFFSLCIKILATGICHSDVFFWKEEASGLSCPLVLGHEAIGVVESVGPGVTTVKPGDTVIPGFHPQCRSCTWCQDPRTNICEKFALTATGRMMDDTSRVTWKGQPVCVLSSIGTFSEYIVAPEICVAKVKPVPNPAEACLLGCAIPTGYGSAVRTAEVKPGSTVAVWGLGGVGLAVVLGCKDRGAARIIGVDINPAKFPLAKKLGCTECIDTTTLERSVPDTIMEMVKGGLDYAFVSVGNPGAMVGMTLVVIISQSIQYIIPTKCKSDRNLKNNTCSCVQSDAVKSTSPFWGTTVAIGLSSPGATMEVDLLPLVQGRTIRGVFMGDLSSETGLSVYLGIMRCLREAVRLKRPERWQNNDWILHVGNARPHTAHVVLQFLAKHSTIQIPHPPYSPDLAPNDFFLYPKLKMNLKGRKFDNVDMIQAESKATLRNLSKSNAIRDDVPKYVEWYLDGKLPLKDFVSHTLSLDEINEGIQLLKSGKS
ncbi:ADH5 [Cordylochernes scorpioides]|uniref:ADH5 n=1 Tax=Cordylochernes scorpioides TaxID=51811 RepID=A0ABY6LHI2_9ARAC|nr:ADH5 [Cordylochernes scorpioides]